MRRETQENTVVVAEAIRVREKSGEGEGKTKQLMQVFGRLTLVKDEGS